MSYEFFKTESNQQSYYFINNNFIIHDYTNLCVKDNNKIDIYSNEWLYLIRNGPNVKLIQEYINNNKDNSTYINEDIIPFITSFKTSVHCFAGIFSILLNYFNNLDYYSNCKIAIYKNVQKGIIDLILFFCDSLQLSKDNLIFLDENIIYKCKSITIIPNTLHSYFENIEIRDNIYRFIDKFILSKQEFLNLDKYKINDITKNISIIKTFNNSVTSTMGAVSEENAIEISKKYDCSLIDLSLYNEIQIIKIINNSEFIVFSWGTTFMKNYIYISDFCQKVIVIVIGSEFINEYNHLVKHNLLVTKFKNASFYYNFDYNK